MIDVVNAFTELWFDYFSYALIQNTIFLALVFLALYFLRNAHARLKYNIAIIGILKLLIPPFLPATFGSTKMTPTAAAQVDLNGISVMSAHPVEPHLSLAAILIVIWGLALIAFLFSSLLSTAHLSWTVKRSRFIKTLFIENTVYDIYQAAGIRAPMSIGIRPSRIYVPSSWDELDRDQQDSLLRHEIEHIRRWDGLFHIFQVIAQAVYFFHPLVWLLNERINEYREMACDDAAIEHSRVTPLAYSRCLVHVAENMLPQWSCSSASALIKQRNKLYHRVNYLVKEAEKMKIISNRQKWLVVGLLAALMLSLSWYEGQAEFLASSEKSPTKNVGYIEGTVTDISTNEPLKDAVVWVEDFAKSITDAKGFYSLQGLPLSEFTIKVLYKGKRYDSTFDPQSQDIPIYLKSNFERIKVDMQLNLKEPQNPPKLIAQAMRLDNKSTHTPNKTPNQIVERNANKAPKNTNNPNITGKIWGKVVDQKTGKPLHGANIVLKGTNIGAATDTRGQYFIPNVPPGNYQLECAFMGYKSVLMTDVRVVVNQSAQHDFKMHTAKVNGEKISVTAQMPKKPGGSKFKFVAYDEAPLPVDGWEAIRKNLVYPELARKAGIAGRVVVNAHIDEKGNIVDTEIEKSLGNNGCDEAAVAAIKSVKWMPAKQRNKPVSVWVTLPVEFNLR